ncbi:hypothetical protein ANCCEY_08812 [Ancylostoma ceylanicum]|uniref:Ankyrin repeat protein n=1 Tax=Ancylostoma ceylanicum TaxID=53326 RepID=A0A0D6LJ56_9BILA|nr:hypothetical protein ANCCEY_08812 [Ancylostoma ceylanicum]
MKEVVSSCGVVGNHTICVVHKDLMTSETSGSGDVVQVITKSGEACAPPTSTVEMEDPFDDPALVTNAFLDIMWQDSHGNSALMLAAAENRILHVKGILTMAVERGTLWQMLEMRNEDGLTALEMAVRAGSDTCATLITKFAKEAQKSRPSPAEFGRSGIQKIRLLD